MPSKRSEDDEPREKPKPSTHVPGSDPANTAGSADPMGQPPDSPPNPNLPPDYENEPADKPTK